jgi:hypothetical protein
VTKIARWLLAASTVIATIVLAALNSTIIWFALAGIVAGLAVGAWLTRRAWQFSADVTPPEPRVLALILIPVLIVVAVFSTFFLGSPGPINTRTLPYEASINLEGQPEGWVVVERYSLASESRTSAQVQADLGGVPEGWSIDLTVNDTPVLVSSRTIPIPVAPPYQLTTWISFRPTAIYAPGVRFVPADSTITVTAPRFAIVATEPASDPASASQGLKDARTFNVAGSDLNPGNVEISVQTLRPEARNEVLYRMGTVSASSLVGAALLGLWTIVIGMLKEKVGDLLKAIVARFRRKPSPPPAVP